MIVMSHRQTVGVMSLFVYLDCRRGITAAKIVAACCDQGLSPAALSGELLRLGIPCRVAAQPVAEARMGTAVTFHAEGRPDWAALDPAPALRAPGLSDGVAGVAGVALANLRREGRLPPIADGEVPAKPQVLTATIALRLIGAGTLAVSRIGLGDEDCGPDKWGRLELDLVVGLPIAPGGPGRLVDAAGLALAGAIGSRPHPPAMDVAGTGRGFGPAGPAGGYTDLVCGRTQSAAESIDESTVCVIAANIDDQTPEYLAHAADQLRAAGALDVWMVPAQMKKGRPGAVLRALCRPGMERRLIEVLARETTTLGVRYHHARRSELQRRLVTVATPFGQVAVKVGFLGRERVTVAPEFEDCRRVAETCGVPARLVYEAALAAAQGEGRNS